MASLYAKYAIGTRQRPYTSEQDVEVVERLNQREMQTLNVQAAFLQAGCVEENKCFVMRQETIVTWELDKHYTTTTALLC